MKAQMSADFSQIIAELLKMNSASNINRTNVCGHPRVISVNLWLIEEAGDGERH